MFKVPPSVASAPMCESRQTCSYLIVTGSKRPISLLLADYYHSNISHYSTRVASVLDGRRGEPLLCFVFTSESVGCQMSTEEGERSGPQSSGVGVGESTAQPHSVLGQRQREGVLLLLGYRTVTTHQPFTLQLWKLFSIT